MPSTHPIPLLLSVLIGFLLGFVALGLFQARSQQANDTTFDTQSNIFWGLLMLAAFALGVFLTYVLLSPEVN